MQVEQGEHDVDSFAKPLLKDIFNQGGYNGGSREHRYVAWYIGSWRFRVIYVDAIYPTHQQRYACSLVCRLNEKVW